ncbi:ABC transporter ATP-binding protein [Agrococcus jejuensis]|uniref:ABC transporter ATP-binding protein n=1 Tax=Agrococcus jejuensis TaxID=399736 RepID=UPI0011A791F8|nr:ABC transporter ATP-binding protein [Agrococcus jejuensis]
MTAPRPQTATTIDLQQVVKRYGSHTALDSVDLTLAPGELVALLGPSGCGKTTALRCLAGLEDIQEGRILMDGVDVSATPIERRDIGIVFQAYSLFPHMTAAQNVGYGLRMRGVGRAERETRVAEGLELVGLAHLGERFAHELSGGQQQRVALARAIVTRPRLLLLDEPLSALDAKVRVSLRDEIRRIQQELGITTVFVTHDQEEALAVADRVAVMRAGRIEQIGSPEDLYRTPANPFVADFVGLSNRVAGIVDADGFAVRGERLPVLGAPALGAGVALVRPEHVRLAATGIAATVVTSAFLGSIRRTTVDLGDGTIVAVQHDASEVHEPGDAVHVAFTGAPVVVEPSVDHGEVAAA